MKLSNFIKSLLIVFFSVLSFTGCSEEKVASTDCYYSMGISSMNTGNGMIKEIQLIDNAFREALGVSESTFKLTGEETDCDSKVLKAATEAQAELEDYNFEGKYTFTIYRIGVKNDVMIYEYTFE